MKLGILECDHVPDQFRHIAGDYSDMVSAVLSRNTSEFDLELFDVSAGRLPSVDDCDAFLCLGSHYSVYEKIDWIDELKNFVRETYQAQRSFVGICFGHQLLAAALDGQTARAPEGWGVGVHDMQLVMHEEWMRPEQESCALNFMHQDQVTRLPKDGLLLGSTDHCPIAMFRVGRTMLGIQAHPELTTEYCEALLTDRIDRIGENKVTAARSSLDQPTDQNVLIKWIANFLKSTE